MPKYYVIDESYYTSFESEEDAVTHAKEMGSNGILVKALGEVSWEHPAPVFTLKKLED